MNNQVIFLFVSIFLSIFLSPSLERYVYYFQFGILPSKITKPFEKIYRIQTLFNFCSSYHVIRIAQNREEFSEVAPLTQSLNDTNATKLTIEQVDIRTTNDERLIDIYIFTGITVATIAITLTRSFLFFNVSIAYLFSIIYSL